MPNHDKAGPEDLQTLLKNDQRRSFIRKLIIIIIVLLLAGAGFIAYRLVIEKKSADRISFETVALRRGDLKSSITTTGTVEALNTVEVGAEISGRIQTITVDFNDHVEKDQLLIKLDPQQQKSAVGEAKAKVLSARAGQTESSAALLEATQTEKRVKALAGRGLASAKELEAATAAVARAQASVASAKASAALAQAAYEAAADKLEKTEIRSPIDGTVLSREVEAGQAINAGMQTPVLFVIAEDLKRMRLSSQVDEADIGVVKTGLCATFTVDAYPDRIFESEVVSVRNVPVSDQNVVSYEVILTVDNSDLLLKPGMTATVDIITAKQEDVLIVPNKALRFTPPGQNEKGSRMRGPPMPLLGTKRGGRTKEGDSKPDSMAKIGKVDSDQGIVWMLKDAAPAPVKVEKIATDGTDTAIESGEIGEGDEVIVDISESTEK